MEEKEAEQILLNRAYFFLKFRLRSEVEMQQYLIKKAKKLQLIESIVESVIAILKEEGLIDDKKFVGAYISQRNILKPKGEYVLRGELIKHGIAKELIDDYFLTYPINEEELAYKILLSRWKRFKNLPPQEKYRKAINFLYRRGFSFEIAKVTYKKLVL